MKSFLVIIFNLIVLNSGLNTIQTSIDYQPKDLLKALKKVDVDSFDQLEEIKTNDSSDFDKNGKFFKILDAKNDKYKYVYIGRVTSCRSGVCIPASADGAETSEYFDYFIIFDSKATVKLVKVYNYQATHGQEITSRGWLSQFIGHKSSKKLIVDKNIDSISGATISVQGITDDIRDKTEVLSEMVEL